MRAPFQRAPTRSLRRLLIGLGASTLICALLMAPSSRAMRRRGSGIVAFELAGSRDRAAEILRRWGAEGRASARTSLILDYPFLVSYSLCLSVGCVVAGRAMDARGWTVGAGVAAPAAWGQLIAGVLDGIENAALLALLDGRDDLPFARIAATCALPKFVLSLGIGLPYVMVGVMAWGTRGRRRLRG